MASLSPVICRANNCKKPIDRNKEIEGVDWMKDPDRKGWYWHVACYNATQSFIQNPSAKNEVTDEMWFDAIWNYLTKIQKINMEFTKVNSQFQNFQKKKYTPKGMYFTLKFFYEIQKGDRSKAEGGIGIIPFVYAAATEYWTKIESQKRGFMAEIEAQIMKYHSLPTVKVKRTKAKTQKQKHLIDLDTIGDTDD